MAEVLRDNTARSENEDERVCGICLKKIAQLNDVRRLECDHLFCMDCLKTSTKHEDTARCAVCRAVFDCDLENLKVEHHTDDSTQIEDKSVYSIKTHRCAAHTTEITTMGCSNCLAVFCCECLNESMLCPCYDEEGFHKLCSFGSLLDYFNDKMDEQKMLLHRMKFKLEDCDKQLLNTCDNLEENGRDVFEQITEGANESNGDKANTAKDYLNSVRSKRDECSKNIQEQVNQIERLTKEKEGMISKLKPEDFVFEVEIFTRQVEQILMNELPEFKMAVLSLSEGTMASFKLQYDDFKLDYDIEIPSPRKSDKVPESPMPLQIKNIYLHDSAYSWASSSSGPNHPEYYKMPNPRYALSTKVVEPWFVEKSYTRLVFAYPIEDICEDSKNIYVFTEHSLLERHRYPVRTLFRWNKITETMAVMFRTTQFIRNMTMDDEHILFRGDWRRRWRVNKEFESGYKYSVLTKNPRYSPFYGIERY